MAIVRVDGGRSSEMARRVGLKAAKKAGKKVPGKKLAEKHAAKKHVGKKAAKSTGAGDKALRDLEAQSQRGAGSHAVELALAFHHLQRAGAVISLLEHDSGGDLKMLLEHGIELYRKASGSKTRKAESVLCAHGLLRAAEHLGMAGLYAARADYRAQVAPPRQGVVADHLKRLRPRLDALPIADREVARRLESMARELLRRAQDSRQDPHLEYELTMAAEGICAALEEGL